MLTINLKPSRAFNARNEPMSWSAPVLSVGDKDYDLSELGDGGVADHPALGIVTRSGDDYEVSIVLYFGANAPSETRNPSPIVVESDGPITLPPYDSGESQ